MLNNIYSDKEFTDKIHLLIHSVRLLPNYKPTNFEKSVSKEVIVKYKDSCKDCQEVYERSLQPTKTWINKLGDSLTKI